MQMTEDEIVEFCIRVIRELGGNVGDYDATAHTLLAWLNDTHTTIDLLDRVWQADKESQRRYVTELLLPPGVPTNKWTAYLNHAVLIRRAVPAHTEILDVRVESISPSGKFVRFMGLSFNLSIWAPVDHYDLLEDLGMRVQEGQLKKVSSVRR